MTAYGDPARSEKSISLDPPTPPGWVGRLVSGHQVEGESSVRGGTILRTSESAELGLVRATIPGAKHLPDRDFRVCVERAYLAIGDLLRERGHVPLRFWNYVPGIRARGSGGLSRYEVFNVGRYLAYTTWYENARLGEHLAAASAVDHRGDDLAVHVLAGRRAGIPLENPRQTPAYRYSRRFGPLPPCFSRATIVSAPLRGGAPWAIVAGTSSIVGEDTRHAGDCEAQLEETLLNLAHLSAAFVGDLPRAELGAEDRASALARFRHLRVYVVRDADAARAVARLRRACPELEGLEAFAADLCRDDLLVEVEGVLGAARGRRVGSRRQR
jgi:chorismate lyase/3-hydroxybenzoate synthase